MCGPFHNRSSVIVNWKNEWTNSYVKCTVSCEKQPIFVSKRNSFEKETSEIFDCTRLFSLQSLNSTVRLFGNYFFGQLELLYLQ